jgi:hypothetical protein
VRVWLEGGHPLGCRARAFFCVGDREVHLLLLFPQEPGAADVLVNNLAPEVDDATLAEAFGNSGRVLSATVFRDQMTGQR